MSYLTPIILFSTVFLLGLFYGQANGTSNNEQIFVRGKWFNKNGKSSIPVQKQFTPADTFLQCLDHLNPNGCDTTWNQRYWIRRDYYQPGGPIFIQFGGEGPADGIVDLFHWHSYAEEYNALLVVLENRFYGGSIPTTNSSIEALQQLLTSQQTLADAAYFIETYSAQNNITGEWVAFGGSYAGNLAAWLKQMYPNHVKLAVASSAPLEAIYDFRKYMETVSDVVKTLEPSCYDKIFETFSCMESLIIGRTCGNYTSPNQIAEVLNLCESPNFDNRVEKERLFYSLAVNTWARSKPVSNIVEKCTILNSVHGSDPLTSYALFLALTEPPQCIKTGQSEAKEILQFINSEEGRQSGAAGWFWQTCYEFGFFFASDPVSGLFGYDTFSGDATGFGCSEQYGPIFNYGYIRNMIVRTNDFYKGKAIDAKCVIYTNGEWDPWHSQGINDSSETSANNTVIFIPRGEHTDYMLDMNKPEVIEAQGKIATQIGVYLNDPSC